MLTGLLCFILSAHTQQVTKKEIQSTISGVTVYLSGAEIKRKTEINLEKGLNELRFIEISAKADSRSIQFETDQNVEMLSITMERDFLSLDESNKKIKQIKDSLQYYAEKTRDIDDELGALEAEKQVLAKNQKIGGENVSLTVEQIKSTAEFYRKRTGEINKTVSGFIRQKDELAVRTAKLRQQLLEYNYKENAKNNVIVILVEVPQSGKINATLKYNVNSCGWAPSYDLIAEDISGKIELKYKAKVFNNTGNDWEDVNIKLSTGDPNLSASSPSLNAWYLNSTSFASGAKKDYSIPQAQNREDNYKQQVQKNERTLSDFEGRTFNADFGDIGGVTTPVVAMTTIEVSELTTEFEIEKKYSIPSDSRPYIVEITEYSLDATFEHVSVPKLDKDAFLLAKIAGWEQLDLVPGPTNVYFAQTYVGESYINTRNVEDTLGLSFGRDKKILITRKKIEEFSSKKVVGNWKRDVYTYEIIVKNNRNRPIRMEMKDQVPVSQDSDITVTVEEISGANLDPAEGLLKWDVQLQPGEAKKYTISFTIKYPKNKNVQVKQYRSISAPSF